MVGHDEEGSREEVPLVRDQKGRSSPEDSPQAGLRTRRTTRVSDDVDKGQGHVAMSESLTTVEIISPP